MSPFRGSELVNPTQPYIWTPYLILEFERLSLILTKEFELTLLFSLLTKYSEIIETYRRGSGMTTIFRVSERGGCG